MADFRFKDPSNNSTVVIDDNASLSDGSRAAADYDNSTSLDFWYIPFLTVQYDGGPPSAGDDIAELFILPGDADDSEAFPNGGDAGLGTDDDPQRVFFVGTFVSVTPSTTVDEILALPPIQLYPHGNRFVLKNVSGQTLDSTWQLEITPFKTQTS